MITDCNSKDTVTWQDNLLKIEGLLSRIDGVEILETSDCSFEGHSSIYFRYKDKQSSIEEKVRFIDNFARILGSSDDYDAYEANISMCWMGSKGIDDENRPLFVMNMPNSNMIGVIDVLQTRLDIMPTVFAIATNYPTKRRNIYLTVKKCFFPSNNLVTHSFFMFFISTLAKTARFFKYSIFRLFTNHLFHRHKSNIPKGMRQPHLE